MTLKSYAYAQLVQHNLTPIQADRAFHWIKTQLAAVLAGHWLDERRTAEGLVGRYVRLAAGMEWARESLEDKRP